MATKDFKLPPRWYRSAVEASIAHLEESLGPLTPENAWLFLYCCVVWKDELPKNSGEFYLHINDRLKTKSGKDLARRAEDFLRSQIPSRASLDAVINQIGRRYESERSSQGVTAEWQRNNITGNSLEATLQVLIHRLTRILPSRTPPLNSLQGFELAPQGYHSRPDLALFSARDFRMLISTKWTLRKERIGTYLHEAYFYKRRRPDLQVAFVVAEFNSNILKWLVNDPLVDRVYHVGLPLLLSLHEPWLRKSREAAELISLLLNTTSPEAKEYANFSELTEKIFSLQQLFTDITYLRRPSSEFSADPEDEDAKSDENGGDDA